MKLKIASLPESEELVGVGGFLVVGGLLIAALILLGVEQLGSLQVAYGVLAAGWALVAVGVIEILRGRTTDVDWDDALDDEN